MFLVEEGMSSLSSLTGSLENKVDRQFSGRRCNYNEMKSLASFIIYLEQRLAYIAYHIHLL